MTNHHHDRASVVTRRAALTCVRQLHERLHDRSQSQPAEVDTLDQLLLALEDALKEEEEKQAQTIHESKQGGEHHRTLHAW